MERIEIKEKEKFKIIYKMSQKKNNRLNISYMCKVANVSRSGYYKYVKNLTSSVYLKKEMKDKQDYDLILSAYKFKNRHKGARAIKMVLERQEGICINLKKIRRLMKKYGLKCPIRKANPYRRMMKALRTSSIAPNKINRNFYEGLPGQKLLTDITYLYYSKERTLVYLSTIKDSVSREILSWELSESLDVEFVLKTVNKLYLENKVPINKETIIHSDQGIHYTSKAYQDLLSKLEIIQSMSRRGNCWDNAPQESFYGHMKDELYLKDCNSIKEVFQEINDYMDYYNNYRYQWDLNKMSPTEYRIYLLEGNPPLLVNKKTEITEVKSV